MRRLQGGIPRAFRSHKGPEGALYGAYGRAWIERFGGELPADLRLTLRTAGRLAVEITQLEADHDRARHRRRLTEVRRIRRQLTSARMLLLKAETRLEERAAATVPDHLRALSRGGER